MRFSPPSGTSPVRRRWAALAAVAATSLVVAGCGGGGGESGGAGVADFIPADSPIYAEITTDLNGPQWTQAVTLLKRFPAYPELERELREGLNGEGIDFQREVQPLLGERAAVGVGVANLAEGAGSGNADVDLEDPEAIAAVELSEGSADDVVALLTTKGEATELGEREGVTYYGTEDDDRAAVVDDVLLLAGTEADLFAAIDAHAEGGDAVIGGVEKFTDALDTQPADTLARMYVDAGQLAKVSAESSEAIRQFGLGFGDLENAVIAGSLTSEPDGFRAKFSALNTGGLEQAPSFTPSLTANVPGDAVAYVGFANLADQIQLAIEQIQANDEDVSEQLAGAAQQLEGTLGVEVEDLQALATGEHGLVVTGGAAPAAGLALKVEDGARAKQTLDALRTGSASLLALAGATDLPPFREVALANGVSGWELPLDPRAGVVYGVDGDLAIIGTSADLVRSIQAPASPLSGNADFTAATADVPDEVTSLLWVNGPQAVSTLDGLGAFADEPELKANLEPIKYLVGWSTGGDTITAELFLRIG